MKSSQKEESEINRVSGYYSNKEAEIDVDDPDFKKMEKTFVS